MRNFLKYKIVGLFLAVATPIFAETHNGSNSQLFLKVENNRISLQARQVPLRDFLSEISRKAPYIFTGEGAQALDLITMTLSNEPLDEAIEQILVGYSFIAVHQNADPNSTTTPITKIRVLLQDNTLEVRNAQNTQHRPKSRPSPKRKKYLTYEELEDRQIDGD